MSIEQNKANAIAFYKMAYEGNPRAAAEKYLGKEYIQHNPALSDGPEDFIRYFERLQREYPEKSIEFVRCIGEGNLVALHTHQTWPGNLEYVTMDFFRFDENGKICEHWDAIQEIPDQSKTQTPCTETCKGYLENCHKKPKRVLWGKTPLFRRIQFRLR